MLILRNRSSSTSSVSVVTRSQIAWIFETYDKLDLVDTVPNGNHLFELLRQEPIVTSPDKILNKCQYHLTLHLKASRFLERRGTDLVAQVRSKEG